MADRSEIVGLSAIELRRRVEKRELTPSEIVRASLEQIQEYNRTINAVVTLNERALDDAKKLDAQALNDRQSRLGPRPADAEPSRASGRRSLTMIVREVFNQRITDAVA